jgi:hypothetical protein
MKIEGTITERDYVKARNLAMKSRPWVTMIGTALLVFYCIAIFVQEDYIFLIFTVVPVVCVLSGLWLIRRRKLKQAYQQDTLFQTSFICIFDDNGLKAQDEYGSSNLPWYVFHKWRENTELFLLYPSDLRFHVFPKRFFDSPESINEFRRFAQEKIGKAG